MFNINSLAHGIDRVYDTKKKRVIRAMKADRNALWKHRGQRFEVFRPRHENPEPSEWFIPLYAAIHPWTVLGFANPESGSNVGPRGNEEISRASSIGTLFRNPFRRRVEVPKEEWRLDEGWVL